MVTPEMCLKKFGDPYLQKTMVVWNVPENLEIGFLPNNLYCNSIMISPLSQAFQNIIDGGFVDEIKTWDGCFNIRKQRGSKTKQSLHSWGIAVDINAFENGLGQKPKLSDGFVKCFTDAGFDWGGNFKRLDGMHFQLSQI